MNFGAILTQVAAKLPPGVKIEGGWADDGYGRVGLRKEGAFPTYYEFTLSTATVYHLGQPDRKIWMTDTSNIEVLDLVMFEIIRILNDVSFGQEIDELPEVLERLQIP